MVTAEFDEENIQLIARGQFDEVERRLAENYEEAKTDQDPARLLHAISSLAHFYALPFKEDLVKAEHYFKERFARRPGADAALELAMFCHYSLRDPERTLEQTGRVRSLTDRCKAGDLRFLYSAIAIEGQAYLALGQNDDAIRDLEELLEMAERDPEHVPFGDEFNLLEEFVEHKSATDTCWRLLKIVRHRVRSAEHRDKVEKLLHSQGREDGAC